MDRAEALLAVAQIALGLAGFGGVFVALSHDRARTRGPADTYRLVLLLCTALSTLVLSLLPIAFQSIGVSERALWALSSALMAALLVWLLVVTLRWRRGHPAEIRAGELPWVAGAVSSLALLCLVGQMLNAAGLFRPHDFGVFFLGLVFMVAFGSYLFARMLFLWRS